jgi:hypothetical protein
MGHASKGKDAPPRLDLLDTAALERMRTDPATSAMNRAMIGAELARRGEFPEELQNLPADPGQVHTATTTMRESGYTGHKPLESAPVCGLPLLSKMSDVVAEEVDWLWPGRIPIGMMTLLFGDGGVGKSQIALALASHVSQARPWPDDPKGKVAKGKVILIQSEDSLTHTVRPRVDAAKADATRIIALTGIKRPDNVEAPFQLREHLAALAVAVKKVKDVRLVVIDPISAFLGGADECKNAEVRFILSPLGALAEKHGFAVLMIHHVNKGTGVKAMYRASGSLAFINASRMAWFACKDPESETRCFLAPVKCNIGPMPNVMAFTAEKQAIRFDPDPVLGISANSILAQERTLLMDDDGQREGRRGPLPAKIRACIEKLIEFLGDGPQPQRQAASVILESGYHPGTFYEAIARGPFEKYPHEDSNWLRLAFGVKSEGIAPGSNGHANGSNGGAH